MALTKKISRWCQILFAVLPSLIFAIAEQHPEPIQGPWFTGPLLTPSASTIPFGHVAIEPYIYINNSIGSYGGHWTAHSKETFTTVSLQAILSFGLTSFMDIQTFPQIVYNHTSGQSATRFADLPVQVNFQVCREQKDSWRPDIKFALLEIFPTGQFEKLNPEKKKTDASGEGSYISVVRVMFAKSRNFGGTHFLRSRLAFSYAIPSAVKVEGLNAFGGAPGTSGKVYPGNEFVTSIGLEYSPTLHWAFALDILGITGKKTKFSGETPSSEPTAEGSVLPFENIGVGGKSFEQFSLAPAIEYNFSANYGLTSGVWFTVAGRNSSQFVNGVLAFNMYF